jgi:phytoene dehydrogenase-like protein
LCAYSNFVLPSWIKRLADFPRNADLFAETPGGKLPAMVVVDYAAIDSGLGGPCNPVSVVGLDRITNWDGLDRPTYEDKRKRWQDAIVTAIDGVFPGFASAVTVSTFSTASTMQSYLAAPAGAVYGFAPRPPSGPISRGLERSPRTPIPCLYLASSYASSGGFTGAITGGSSAADCVLADA